MMQRIFIYGDEHAFRLISEFSLFEMKVEVFDKNGQHAISADDLKGIGAFLIAGMQWRKLWQHSESDERGAYTAVALTCRRYLHLRRRVN